jgi:hypothetical protein
VQGSRALFVSTAFSSEAISDAMRLLHGPRLVAAALAHCHQLVRAARKAQRREAKSAAVPSAAGAQGALSSTHSGSTHGGADSARLQLKQTEKKLWFYVVWWHSVEDSGQTAGLLAHCRRDLAAEQAFFAAETASVREGAVALEARWGGQRPKRLIETL